LGQAARSRLISAVVRAAERRGGSPCVRAIPRRVSRIAGCRVSSGCLAIRCARAMAATRRRSVDSAYPPDDVFFSKTSPGRRGGDGGARARSGPQAEPLRRQSRPRQPFSLSVIVLGMIMRIHEPPTRPSSAWTGNSGATGHPSLIQRPEGTCASVKVRLAYTDLISPANQRTAS
jgi:hypothetical protein